MNDDGLEYQRETGAAVDTAETRPVAHQGARESSRGDPRRELVTKAFVAIPPLTSRMYEVREVSRGGLFLVFKEPVTTLLEMEQAEIGIGTTADVAFAASVDDQRHRFNVRARIARITRDGIGLQFLTRNPPQLAGLREFFARAVDAQGREGPRPRPASGSQKPQAIGRPADDSGWQDWEILD